ncbi:glycosyltransferase [Sphingomonas sp. SUN019]|uniref:glycosyltransferase n=1 Tax=Sphingomonas sp. SUN019 TaxID=2937788 RepID=UPI0021640797|nr:glycosyltransferase [Sphingomonas sp. SUN019]UVO50115.1 glycosyltransferase [Sphingomonas sp. SUN019]
MNRPIGYYVHHHGVGHRARALAIADRAAGRFTLLGTDLSGRTGPHPFVDLPDDRIDTAFDGADGDASRPEALHYAPIDHGGIRRRVAAITAWIADARPALMVVDVSCDIAMLARLASVSTVCVRLGGRRDDVPHLQAFRAATGIVAPFAAALDDPATPGWVRDKTAYRPGIVTRPAAATIDKGSVLVVVGAGGSSTDGADWARAARALPDRRWSVIGACRGIANAPENLTILGWVDDAAARIARAGVVIGSAGNGVLGIVIAARRPFVCIPEPRPFDEQRSNARGLVAAGAAVACDDVGTADWRALIAAAERIDPAAAAALDDPNGAEHAADYLISLADGGRA